MAIIWPYPSTPSSYVSAGQQVVVPPQRCPTCLRVNWSAGWVLALAASAAVPRTDLDAPWSVYGRVSVITKSVRTCGARVSSHSNWGMLLAQRRRHLLLVALSSPYGLLPLITQSVRTCGARVTSPSNSGMPLAQPRGHLLLIARLLT